MARTDIKNSGKGAERPLSGRAIVITGAGRGLGEAYAADVALAGASVVVNDIDGDEAHRVVEAIRASGGVAVVNSNSVTEAEAAQGIISTCVDRFGRIDGLVNNAGIFFAAAPWATDLARARYLVEVNVLGTIYCGTAAIVEMQARGGGSILNVTSGAHLGIPGMSIYGASKGAVASLTYGWARDSAVQGIRVNAISPVARTRMGFDVRQAVATDVATPADIAPVVTFMLSDAAAHINGRIIRFTGSRLGLMTPPRIAEGVESDMWDIGSIGQALGEILGELSNNGPTVS